MPRLSRRTLLALLPGVLAAGALPGRPRAEEEVIEITWNDLVPAADGLRYDDLRGMGVVEHGEMSSPFDQAARSAQAAVTTEFDGRTVRLPGYVVPLDYDGTGTTAFLLVPYVGACIHVPPPPPNQIVFVTTETPYEVSGLFAPVWVTGMFGTSAAETQLAEVGYALSAERIEPYE